MSIIYKYGNLFDAPTGSILLHSCNTRGIWGAGIAREFARRFPEAYNTYAEECEHYGDNLLGTALLADDGDYTIGCLFTSSGYGKQVDPPNKILIYTKSAIEDLIDLNHDNQEIHTCKINSGLFKVPWEQTEAILKEAGANLTVHIY